MNFKLSRRSFIKWLSALGGVVSAKMVGLVPEVRAALSEERVWTQSRQNYFGGKTTASQTTIIEGELYEGFILLPDGVPIPSTVAPPKIGMPIICGAGVGRDGVQPTAVIEPVDSDSNLANKLAFPMYSFIELPIKDKNKFRRASANLMRHNTGELFAAAIDFQSYNKLSGSWETTVSIWAQPDFPKPFPLWYSEPVEPDGPAVILEKVDFLPAPGIMVATGNGYVFHWIKDDVFYTLVAENSRDRETAVKLAKWLDRLR